MAVLSTLQSYFSPLTDQLRGPGLDLAVEYKWSILAGTVATYAIFKYLSRPKNLPPGPRGLPIIGAIMDLTPNFHEDCVRFSQQYKSDIISFYTGGQLQVALNSADAIKMAFVKNDDFSHRDPDLAEWMGLHDKVVVAMYSEEWSRFKSFCIASLKTHGFSNVKLEQSIKLQLTRMIRYVECLPDNIMESDDIKALGAKAGACIIMKIYASRDYEFDDPELNGLLTMAQKAMNSFFEHMMILFFYANMLPSYIMWFVKRKHVKVIQEAFGAMGKFFEVILEEHKETLDVDNPRDFIDDLLILKMRTPGLTELEVVDTIVQLSPDAIDTFSILVIWILYFVCSHQEVQGNMLNEITSVCGDNVPSLKDRSSMTYCEAVIIETRRMSSIFPFTASHRNDKDAWLGGYFIPKNTLVLGNLYGSHYDERIFKEPAKFKPERFLTSEGKLTNIENVVAFGAGRRKCFGEPLAKSEAFIYVTGLVQKFELSFPEDHEPAPFQFDAVDRVPPAHKMKFTARY